MGGAGYRFADGNYMAFNIGETGAGKGVAKLDVPNLIIDNRKLQKKWKHSKDFGVEGNFNKSNAKLLKERIEDHVKNSTHVYKSTYRGNPVYVYLKDGVGVYTDITGEFISGWKFSEKQIEFHKHNGRLIK